ncbi:unnamed protein product [Discosporangium mesarthrocarpum]
MTIRGRLRHSSGLDPPSPGPGHYISLFSSNLQGRNVGGRLSTSGRMELVNSLQTPGPGAYEPLISPDKNTLGVSLKGRHKQPRPEVCDQLGRNGWGEPQNQRGLPGWHG